MLLILLCCPQNRKLQLLLESQRQRECFVTHSWHWRWYPWWETAWRRWLCSSRHTGISPRRPASWGGFPVGSPSARPCDWAGWCCPSSPSRQRDGARRFAVEESRQHWSRTDWRPRPPQPPRWTWWWWAARGAAGPSGWWWPCRAPPQCRPPSPDTQTFHCHGRSWRERCGGHTSPRQGGPPPCSNNSQNKVISRGREHCPDRTKRLHTARNLLTQDMDGANLASNLRFICFL